MADKKAPKAKPKALPGDIPFSKRVPGKGAIPDHTDEDTRVADDPWDTWQPPVKVVNPEKKYNSQFGGKKGK
jgi:hypothetical protein